ncbi:CoA-binding protein [Sphingomonas montanisoli]|uniref:CoA-binding protein n=1 Tax=Sphingomonas montanisoli TaxID=2606412 RepID=A0A5D9C1N4_9SPHN|nr:CoA-binding protein [Sphingomonas montanisoli]TZG25212.1 CoA-binding protein [Sphingomonas montanisoli]
MPLRNDDEIAYLLTSAKVIAMVGASDRPERASYGVMRFLQSRGYKVIPVNPTLAGQTIHGEPVLATLKEIHAPIDIVDIFRNSSAAGQVIDDAIAVGAKAVWTQLGVHNDEAVARAEAAGLKAVVDRCPKIEIPRLGL